MKNKVLATLFTGLMCVGLTQSTLAADALGHVTGQFVLDGDMPEIPNPKITKDAAVCAAKELPEKTLVVDSKTKGIANIVVYLKKKPDGMPKKLATPKVKEIVFDQKNCRFTPHVLPVQVGQTVLVKSDDSINHNTHTHPFRNEELNFVVRPNDREGIPVVYEQAEFLPTPVVCDFHPHMKAYWMILDHPYMAVTDAEGKFTIKDLPEGDYEFTVWHELTGYITKELEVGIYEDETEKLDPYKVPASKFTK